MLTDRPYDGPAIVDAYEQEPDWTSFGPGYVDAMSYTYATLGGYLRATADRDRILIVLGDHQPPAAVSGEGAPWDVPVHVIVAHGSAPDRSRILDRLVARGFRAGADAAAPGARPHAHAAAGPARRLQRREKREEIGQTP